MSPFAFVPAVVIAAVFAAVIFVSVVIEFLERKRGRLRKPRFVFRPVVIEGGKGKAAVADDEVPDDVSPKKRPNRL
jgi:hypothetical protein